MARLECDDLAKLHVDVPNRRQVKSRSRLQDTENL
jgi:hypothetical protein